MSLDYPDYEELCKKSKFLGLLWMIGDRGYYLGLFGIMLSPFVAAYELLNRKTHLHWSLALLSGVTSTAFFICIFWSAGQLKHFAVQRGKRLNIKP